MPRRLICTAVAVFLTACTTSEPLPQGETSAILPVEIQAELLPGEGDFAPELVYVSEAAREGGYDKILMDPILYFAPFQQQRTVAPGDRQILLNNFHVLMRRELSKDFEIVLEPQPGTVRVQFAVLPSTREPVALDTAAMVARAAGPEEQVVVDDLVSPLVRNPAAVLLVEAEWSDAVTGEILGATVDRQFGQARFDPGTVKSWAEVNRYLEAYAALIRYRLCRFRGQEDCRPPASPLG